jgi:hypothetical protein
MIVYNITIKVDREIENDWLVWVKNMYAPEIIATGLFSDYKFYYLLGLDEKDGVTYVIQFFASSFEDYKKYIENFEPLFREKVFKKWRDRFVAFDTVMQLVH